MICENCGTHMSDSAKFCPKCGAKNRAPDTAAEPARKCPKCGTENPVSARFCATDGYDLQELSTQSQQTLPPLEGLVCPKCGTLNLSSAKFCKNDGTPLLVQELYDAGTPQSSQWPYSGINMAEPTRKPSRNRIWIAAAALVVVLCLGAAGILYYAGYVGMTPERAQKIVNANLKAKGYPVSVSIDQAWVATVKGPVRDDQERQSSLQIVRAQKHIRDVVDSTTEALDATKIKEMLADVIASMYTLKTAVTGYYKNKGTVAEVRERASLASVYGVDLPDKYAQFSVAPSGAITAVIRDMANDVNGQSITVSPDKELNTWTWTSQLGPKYALVFPQDNAAGDQTASASAPDATPPPSPSALQAQINKELFNRGLENVHIRVSKDMRATLDGYVGTRKEKSRALNTARSHKELKAVADSVEVMGDADDGESWPPARQRQRFERSVDRFTGGRP